MESPPLAFGPVSVCAVSGQEAYEMILARQPVQKNWAGLRPSWSLASGWADRRRNPNPNLLPELPRQRSSSLAPHSRFACCDRNLRRGARLPFDKFSG
eukprot:2998376-Rhodomonas_salina.1